MDSDRVVDPGPGVSECLLTSLAEKLDPAERTREEGVRQGMLGRCLAGPTSPERAIAGGDVSGRLPGRSLAAPSTVPSRRYSTTDYYNYRILQRNTTGSLPRQGRSCPATSFLARSTRVQSLPGFPPIAGCEAPLREQLSPSSLSAAFPDDHPHHRWDPAAQLPSLHPLWLSIALSAHGVPISNTLPYSSIPTSQQHESLLNPLLSEMPDTCLQSSHDLARLGVELAVLALDVGPFLHR